MAPPLRYHRRLFVGLALYSCLLVGCFGLYQFHREKRFKAEELDLRLQMANQRIADCITDSNLSSAAMNADIARLLPPHELAALRVSVFDTAGHMLYDNTMTHLTRANHSGREEIAAAMKAGHGFSLQRHSASTGNTYCYSATRHGSYVVRTALPYDVSLTQMLAADYGFAWFMLGVTLAAVTAGYFVTRRLGENVNRLRNFARRAEAGESVYDDNKPFPHDELGDISAHIVRLYARLQQALADADRQHAKALHQEQEKIRIKRQLTNNINHELKTPVASMKACLETLDAHPNMTAEDRNAFIRRGLNAVSRLQSLLEDVSTITRLEDGANAIHRAQCSLAEIVAESAADLQARAEDRGMLIESSVTPDCVIHGNRPLLSSIVHNLLDNAVAYSGASLVEVKAARLGNTVTLTVADDGCGVADEHLPRLFERFYRVDKGRARTHGGTGLGLAIVRNAVVWHGGTITVQNRRTGGLLFSITLPVAPEHNS